MKTNNKLGAYILRGSTGAVLFSCVFVAICSAIHLPEQPPKALALQDNTVFGANGHQNRSLSFSDRVAYQRAIEDVYWRHRIWPKERPDPKPSLDVVISQAEIEKKVTEYLRNSQALEDYAKKPITADQLQAEMERMASNTKQPEVLRELFAAVGNDAFVIAECLARPIVAERLLTRSEAHGVRIGAGLRSPRVANAETNVSVAIADLSNPNYTLPVIAGSSGGCTDDTWTPTTLTNAPAARAHHTAVWTGSEMIVWGGDDGTNLLNSGGRYNPSTDSWTATNTPDAPSARGFHSAVWTGSEMIVWGGTLGGSTFFNTGGRYNPATDSWIATSIVSAPTARGQHTAVWTGSEMIIWGGFGLNSGFGDLNTGGRYNPGTDSWTPTSIPNAPAAREQHTAVWTNSEMIVWGGITENNYFNTGGRYNPGTDSWIATSIVSAPTARAEHTAVGTDSEMIVWGGYDGTNYLNSGGRYNPSTDSWTSTTTTNAPAARADHTAVWTSSEMIVWGGGSNTGFFDTGGRYNPTADTWIATSTINAPTSRAHHTAVWTGSEMIVWGGYLFDGSFHYLNTGGRYCAQSGTPTPTPTPCTGRCTPTPRSRPTPAPRP